MNATTEQTEALNRLRLIFPKGSTVTTIVRHVSKSGMSRAIQVLGTDYAGNVSDFSWTVARAGILKKYTGQSGLKVQGVGMDMAWYTVYTISQALYGDGYALNNRTL